jgi:hypothetical protein
VCAGNNKSEQLTSNTNGKCEGRNWINLEKLVHDLSRLNKTTSSLLVWLFLIRFSNELGITSNHDILSQRVHLPSIQTDNIGKLSKRRCFSEARLFFYSPRLHLPAGYQERWFLLRNVRNKGLISWAFERRRGLWNLFSIYSGTTPRGEQGSDGCFRRTRSLVLSLSDNLPVLATIQRPGLRY